MLEDTQRILSLNIDEEGEKTLEIISQDFVTLRRIWNKVRQRPAAETVSGKTCFFWHILKKHPQQYNIISRNH